MTTTDYFGGFPTKLFHLNHEMGLDEMDFDAVETAQTT
jgi:hypothetical protein